VFKLKREEIFVIKTNPGVLLGARFFKKPTKDQTEKLEKINIRKQRLRLKSPSRVPEEKPRKTKPELTTPL